MNKLECTKYCEQAIKEMWEKYSKPTEYNKRCEVYQHCKQVCKKNGYVNGAFTAIWNKASDNVHK